MIMILIYEMAVISNQNQVNETPRSVADHYSFHILTFCSWVDRIHIALRLRTCPMQY